MNQVVKPVQVSPLIKGLRWSLLICGIACGVIKLEAYQAYEESVGPKRNKQIKEKNDKMYKEARSRDIKEISLVIQDMEITDYEPGWEDEI